MLSDIGMPARAHSHLVAKANPTAIHGIGLLGFLSHPNGQTLGASGAIFGLMGAFLVIARKLQGNVNQILFWLGINLVFTFTQPGISWQGHLGGLVGGVIATGIIVAVPRGPRRSLIQWSALGVMAVVLLVLVLVKVQTWGLPV